MQGQGRIDTARSNHPRLTKVVEALLLGCSMTVSVVDEYTVELHLAVHEMIHENTEALFRADTRILWKEDDMMELLLQIRGYQNRLKSLLGSLDK